MDLPKDVASVLTHLSTLISRNQNELYANTIDELLQILIRHVNNEIQFTLDSTHSLCSLTSWIDNECVEQCGSNKPPPSTQVGLDLVQALQNSLINAADESNNEVENEPENHGDNHREQQNKEPAGIDDLLQQLALRKVEKFTPQFADVVLTDSEDEDEDVRVDEQSERRTEKHGSRTAQEEVEKHNDGREIRTKKS
ncbi:hypothetical protein M3Y94_00362000 [Aphelenchoides besseyi]|nr:hypothetical protein M3Y94_00362000 [Aphelenchoides besseyi]